MNKKSEQNYNLSYAQASNYYPYNNIPKNYYQNEFSPQLVQKNKKYINAQNDSNLIKQDNIQAKRNPQYFQNYSSNDNLVEESNTKNYFSPNPRQTNENININNLNNINIETKKNYALNKYNSKKPSKKTLILDLDETLVHSGFHPFNRNSDFTLNITVDGKNHTIYVLKRPFVEEFLSEMAPYFEIIIFTASISEYASTLIDMLDKDKLTSGRLFRQHCLFNHGLYLKDINILKKDLKDVIIIDNNPVSYVMNQDNGLPILTWYDDLNDKELLNFIPLLKYLASVDDVREVIKKIVDKQSNKIKFDIVDQLIENKIIENMKFKNINSQKNDNYERQNMNDIYRNNNNLNRNYNFNQNYINKNKDEKYEMNNNINNNKNYYINKEEENRMKNYINDDNLNLYNNYNNSIHDSLSNMTYNEIQNEGTINNEKESNNNFNSNYNILNKNNFEPRKDKYIIQKAVEYDNHKMFLEKNKNNNINKQKESLYNEQENLERNDIRSNNNFNYKYPNNYMNNLNIRTNKNIKIGNGEKIIKRTYSSNTYTPNIKVSNYRFNNNEANYNNNMNNIRKINQNEVYNNIKVNNYISENNKYLGNIFNEKSNNNYGALKDNYLKSYHQHLFKLKTNNPKLNNNNNIHIFQNKNANSPYIQNLNSQNNFINRNHSINSLNYRRNNMNFINFNNNMRNMNNNNNINNYRLIEENQQNEILKRENINLTKEDYRNMLEDNKQRTTNLRFFKTQNNFMYPNKNRTNNGFNNANNYNQNNNFRFNNNFRRNYGQEQGPEQDRFAQAKMNLLYINNNNELRTLSDKKNLLNNNESNIDLDRKARERKKYNNSPYYANRRGINDINIRNINMDNNLDELNYMNQRTDTDINKEEKNVNILLNNEKYRNFKNDYRNNIMNFSRDKFNDKQNNLMIEEYQNKNNKNINDNYNKYIQKLSKTEERKFYRSSSSKPNNNNFNYLYNNENSRIPRNYNNININNYNFYNSFIDDKNDKINQNKLYSQKYQMLYYLNKNNDDEQENILNRSSSYFHPRSGYYSLLNQNVNSNTPNVLKRNNLVNAKFLNNFGNYRAFN